MNETSCDDDDGDGDDDDDVMMFLSQICDIYLDRKIR